MNQKNILVLIVVGSAGTAGTALLSLQCQAGLPLLLMLFNFLNGLILGDFNVLGSHSRKNSRGFGSILALGTDPITVFVEEGREGNASQSQEGGDRARPVDAQVLIHVGGEQRESGTEERSKDGAGSQS